MRTNAFGLSRSRDEKGNVVGRPINDYVNCLTTCLGGGWETMWVLVLLCYED
jgi:hypothetical protein